MKAFMLTFPLLVLNFCLYMIVCGIAGWAINTAMDYEILTGLGMPLPNPFWAVYFPMGNSATGFFVIFALIAGAVGVAASLSGIINKRKLASTVESIPPASSIAIMAWTLTFVAMGLACKEIHLQGRNSRLQTLEAFTIILTVTQLLYIVSIHM